MRAFTLPTLLVAVLGVALCPRSADAQPKPDSDLAGTTWVGLFTYLDGQAGGTSFMTLIFTPQNKASLSDGKKGHIATYTQKGDEVSFPLSGGSLKGKIKGDEMTGTITYIEIDVLNMKNRIIVGRFSFKRGKK